VATDCCVLSTVLPAADAGVLVRVVSDACAGADDEAHDDTMRILGCYAPLVEVTTTAEVLAEA
jgi:nicotinamidase-related amidase